MDNNIFKQRNGNTIWMETALYPAIDQCVFIFSRPVIASIDIDAPKYFTLQ